MLHRKLLGKQIVRELHSRLAAIIVGWAITIAGFVFGLAENWWKAKGQGKYPRSESILDSSAIRSAGEKQNRRPVSPDDSLQKLSDAEIEFLALQRRLENENARQCLVGVVSPTSYEKEVKIIAGILEEIHSVQNCEQLSREEKLRKAENLCDRLVYVRRTVFFDR